jgi:ribosomal protein S12 methylthiotransferase accessory factor
MSREMIITLPGDLKVDAEYRGHTIKTDQPKYSGGDGSAPEPFSLFLTSMGTCVGIYVVFFCKERGIPYEDIKIIQTTERGDKTKPLSKVHIDIQLPADFPDKYRDAIVRSANQCAVKRALFDPPDFEVITSKP